MINKSKNNILKAFTLAEVLVTLVIIGVVAALTIPQLMANIQENQYKASWRKAFGEIEQTSTLIATDNNGTLKGLFVDADTAKNIYKAKYNIVNFKLKSKLLLHRNGYHPCVSPIYVRESL